ncbi:MAG: DUF4136 domain-containing protein [Pseudomonadota bacterium]
MLKTITQSAIGAALLFGVTACATGVQPTIEAVDRGPIESAQTFAFLSEEEFMQSIPALPAFPVEDAEMEIRGAIQNEMAEAGITFDTAHPDLIVGYMIGVNQVEEQYVDVYTNRFGGVRSIYVTDYDHMEGSLVIDVFDADTGERVYSGWADKDFMAPPRDRRGEIIEDAVDAILSGLVPSE